MRRAVLTGLVVLWAALPPARGAEGDKATVAYLRGLQRPDGGFLPEAIRKDPPAPTLRSTSSALRALKYKGGDPRDRAACRDFVARCFDKATGGYADRPGGMPDVFATVAGIAAAAELGMPKDEYVTPAVAFLAEKARTFEEIRIAAAGLETAGAKVPQAKAWLVLLAKIQKSDGTFGEGPGAARDTGGAAVVLLRLTGELPHRAEVLKVLRAGQRPDGGFGKADTMKSDLETTYRVLRCFHMLKEKPADAAEVRAFIRKCRNADGGYGVAPGQPSTVSGTYFAAMIDHWLDAMSR